jgi:hypothetical protein
LALTVPSTIEPERSEDSVRRDRERAVTLLGFWLRAGEEGADF